MSNESKSRGVEGEALPCGHPTSLLLTSAETGEPLYCELCDAISGRRDAETMEAELRAKLTESEETVRQLTRALGEEVNGPTFMGEPVVGKQASDPTPAPGVLSDETGTTAWIADCPYCLRVIHFTRKSESWTKPMGIDASPQAGASDPTPAPDALVWLVDANQGYAERNGHTLSANWVEVRPGEPMWSDNWKRYALVAPPQAASAPLSPSEPETDRGRQIAGFEPELRAYFGDPAVDEFLAGHPAGLIQGPSSAGPSNNAGADAPPGGEQ